MWSESGVVPWAGKPRAAPMSATAGSSSFKESLPSLSLSSSWNLWSTNLLNPCSFPTNSIMLEPSRTSPPPPFLFCFSIYWFWFFWYQLKFNYAQIIWEDINSTIGEISNIIIIIMVLSVSPHVVPKRKSYYINVNYIIQASNQKGNTTCARKNTSPICFSWCEVSVPLPTIPLLLVFNHIHYI